MGEAQSPESHRGPCSGLFGQNSSTRLEFNPCGGIGAAAEFNNPSGTGGDFPSNGAPDLCPIRQADCRKLRHKARWWCYGLGKKRVDMAARFHDVLQQLIETKTGKYQTQADRLTSHEDSHDDTR
jgi:hypothetical protein